MEDRCSSCNTAVNLLLFQQSSAEHGPQLLPEVFFSCRRLIFRFFAAFRTLRGLLFFYLQPIPGRMPHEK